MLLLVPPLIPVRSGTPGRDPARSPTEGVISAAGDDLHFIARLITVSQHCTLALFYYISAFYSLQNLQLHHSESLNHKLSLSSNCSLIIVFNDPFLPTLWCSVLQWIECKGGFRGVSPLCIFFCTSNFINTESLWHDVSA